MLEFKVKEWFFDTEKVMAAVDKAERQNLSQFGAFVRRRARKLIRPGGKKGKVSAPGEPPRYHSPEPNLRKILFAYEPQKKTVIIGPVILNQSTAVAGRVTEALEKGGRVTVRQGTRRKRRSKTITIRKRPYMVPALTTEAEKFPDIWAHSVKG